MSINKCLQLYNNHNYLERELFNAKNRENLWIIGGSNMELSLQDIKTLKSFEKVTDNIKKEIAYCSVGNGDR